MSNCSFLDLDTGLASFALPGCNLACYKYMWHSGEYMGFGAKYVSLYLSYSFLILWLECCTCTYYEDSLMNIYKLSTSL